MSLQLLLGLALSVLLAGGGSAVVAGAWRMRRGAMAGRLKLLPAATASASAQAAPAEDASALLKHASGRINAAELRVLARACRRWKIPTRHASGAFAALRIGLAVAAGGLALLVLRLAAADAPPMLHVTGAIGPALGAWLAPAFLLQGAAKRHSETVAAGLPEALELLLVCVEAGLSLEDGLERVTRELKWSQPALAEELMQTSADLKILPDRDQALANLAARIDLPSVRSVVTSLSQTLRYGTPLSQALRVTASELRNDSLVALEERANRLPTLLTVPMMLFMMPTIFLIIGGPAAIRMLDAFAK